MKEINIQAQTILWTLALLLINVANSYGQDEQHGIFSENSKRMDSERVSFYDLTWKHKQWSYYGNTASYGPELMRITTEGKVGIGTSTPVYKLDVKGEINATGFKLNGLPFTGSSQWTTIGNSINYEAGNIGITNAEPSAKLEIGTDRPGVLGTPDDIYLKVHGGAIFDNDGDNALTQVSINTKYQLSGSALTVGGPTFIGTWNETKDIANAPRIKTDYLSKYNLWVTLGVVSEDFAITAKDSWKDEVFKEGYKLPTLSEVETFVKQNKHLPGVPSEKEVMEKGYTVHQMNNAFLEKIEHLVLYSIEQEKKLKEQSIQLKEQTVLNEEFKAKLDILQAKLETLSNKK